MKLDRVLKHWAPLLYKLRDIALIHPEILLLALDIGSKNVLVKIGFDNSILIYKTTI